MLVGATRTQSFVVFVVRVREVPDARTARVLPWGLVVREVEDRLHVRDSHAFHE